MVFLYCFIFCSTIAAAILSRSFKGLWGLSSLNLSNSSRCHSDIRLSSGWGSIYWCSRYFLSRECTYFSVSSCRVFNDSWGWASLIWFSASCHHRARISGLGNPCRIIFFFLGKRNRAYCFCWGTINKMRNTSHFASLK